MAWIFLVPPTLTAAYLAWCLKRGKIRYYSTWYYREKNPIWFWTTIALCVFIFLAMFVPFIGAQFPKVFGCDPQHMKKLDTALETTRID
jgi:hypothetical protein